MNPKPLKTRAEAVLAVVRACDQVPRGSWDPDAHVGALADGTGWYWSLSYRSAQGNTQHVWSSGQRWDKDAFTLEALKSVEDWDAKREEANA